MWVLFIWATRKTRTKTKRPGREQFRSLPNSQQRYRDKTALKDNQHTENNFVPSETQTASKPTYADMLTGIKSEKFQKDIERNIIISGISVDREKNDCINSLLKNLEVSIKTESISRIRTVNSLKTQLIRVRLKDTADKWKILNEAEKLKDLEA